MHVSINLHFTAITRYFCPVRADGGRNHYRCSKNISCAAGSFPEPEIFTRNLYMALLSSNSLIGILFSGKEKARLGDCLEMELKKLIWQRYPEYQHDTERNILLSFCIQGCFHAYLNHRDEDLDAVVRVSENVVRNLRPLYFRE